jgi:hypothetical protein
MRQGRFTLDDVIEFASDIEGHPASSRRGGTAIPHDLNKAGLGQGRGYGVTSPLLFYDSLTPAEQVQARSPAGVGLAALFAKGRRDLLRYVPVGGRNLDDSIRRDLARRARFSLTTSAGEAEGVAYTEYVFTFTFPEDADVSDHVVSSTICLSEVAPVGQVGDHDGPKGDGPDP